ncbi:methionine ABC transporter ATP-binding protein [Irregularibacter muris]|uniref:Methionine ABC transporter ATP-binding protein n=1 Tax=Irregularibacter muris TaxID=1796619 RepID=A0AAE3HI30_9FIRM|nr:methionine ABC transporter ATP-binding protein [Irregularibacter muris]MCR1899844.1 methionine ABC transporter ATP-binding protein [Irregularibacter muris]
MIFLQQVSKTYVSKNQSVKALKEVNLHVSQGEIFGIVGYSGAGKSTLIRCINLLERPTTGKIIVDQKELTGLSEKELRQSRKKIGMIFQHFNLMKARNVFQNIAYPLKGSGLSKTETETKVLELLDLVGLKDKVSAYPSQLSGGQKQRVAIARALANDPKVLLCDEATSALDPQTTKSILSLLKQINEKLGLTIVIITHEMQVIKEICHSVALMEDGNIVECGNVLEIFSYPKAQITKEFISSVFQQGDIYKFIGKESFINGIEEEEMLAKISFVGQRAGQPFISKISRLFKVDASILFGNIESIQDVAIGSLVVKFSGGKGNILKSIDYLQEHTVQVEVIKDVRVHTDMATQPHGIIS